MAACALRAVWCLVTLESRLCDGVLNVVAQSCSKRAGGFHSGAFPRDFYTRDTASFVHEFFCTRRLLYTSPTQLYASACAWKAFRSRADYSTSFAECLTARFLSRSECRANPAVLLSLRCRALGVLPMALNLAIPHHLLHLLLECPSGLGTLVV